MSDLTKILRMWLQLHPRMRKALKRRLQCLKGVSLLYQAMHHDAVWPGSSRASEDAVYSCSVAVRRTCSACCMSRASASALAASCGAASSCAAACAATSCKPAAALEYNADAFHGHA